MDDEDYLRILRAEPDNDDVRLAYWDWLEQTGDPRASYVRLMRRRLLLQDELAKTERRLQVHRPPVNDEWADLAFPMRVRSPMVGRCYTKPTPDAPPFVAVGDMISPDTVVCLIEAMCIFNEIRAGLAGVVSEVLVSNKDCVEYNQVLFRISRPSFDFW